MLVRSSDRIPRDLQPGVTHAVLAHGDALMLCAVTLERSVTVAPHAHPHTQAIYVLTGRVRLTVGGDAVEMAAGDSVYIGSSIVHGVTALEDASVLDVFNPQREDFLPYAPHASA
jgi:quercetin dioxygenase-like cupin family protein